MLRKEITQSAIDLAQDLDRRNIGLVAKNGTLLSQLVACSVVQTVPEVSFGQSPEELRAAYQPDPVEIERESGMQAVVTVGEETTPLGSAHSETLEAAVTALQDVVGPQLQFARNIVKPAVVEFHKRLEAALNTIPTTATFNPIIRKICAPEPLNGAALIEAIEEFKDEPFLPITSNLQAPALSGQQVLDLMLTGNKVVDADIEMWAVRVGLEHLELVWGSVFADAGTGQTYDRLIENTITGADSAMTVYLLARKLIDNPIEGVTMTLADWRVAVGALLRQSALRLNHALANCRQDDEVGLLLMTWNSKEISVNKTVYDRFIERGGSDAILFGNVLSDSPAVYVDAILAKGTAHVETWERQNTLLSAATAHRWHSNAREMVAVKAEEMIADHLQEFYVQPGEAGVAALSMNHPDVQDALGKIRTYVDGLDEVGLRDLWKVATWVIAGCVFHYSSAYQLLSGINRYCELNPEMSAAEAAMVATIDYLTDFVVSQLDARPI